MKKPTTIKLPNGLRVLLIPMQEQVTATALVLVETGSKYETKDKNGISHFLEHMCFKGTKNRPSQQVIAEELDGLGAEFNAFTGHEYTGYYAKVAAPYLPKVLDLLTDIYSNPLFKQEDIDQEKGAIVGEIDMYEDMPMRKVHDLFMSLVYGDQPAGWEILGPKKLVTKFTREDFLAYRKAHYVPNATTVVVAGKFDVKKVTSFITKTLGEEKRKSKTGKLKVVDVQTKPKVHVEFKESDQTHLVLGVRTFPITHSSYYPLSILSGVLGSGMSSRLFQKVRTEMGLGYYVKASNRAWTDHGIFAASAGVVNERAEEAVTAIVNEFRRLKDELVGEEELAKTKDMLAGRLILELESSDELTEYYGFQEILRKKLSTPEEVIARMRSVSAKDVQKVAREIFVTEHLNLALIGPWKDKKVFEKLLKF
jgi:predicted Zn-dependent peptidase